MQVYTKQPSCIGKKNKTTFMEKSCSEISAFVVFYNTERKLNGEDFLQNDL